MAPCRIELTSAAVGAPTFKTRSAEPSREAESVSAAAPASR